MSSIPLLEWLNLMFFEQCTQLVVGQTQQFCCPFLIKFRLLQADLQKVFLLLLLKFA
ncbi:Uncharacterised protein [Citrobacter koseri]|uniref:Uncharacterized protein n=1 Tax=Citrobacter koseri TaxID=545 RepID=A0A447UFU2_CITKO|nr:Uncharacterised protein [Citrobacter koseri]